MIGGCVSLIMETHFDDMGGGLRPIGRAAATVLHAIGYRAICFWLDRAGTLRGLAAATAFRHADHIRRKLNLTWGDLIGDRRA